MNPSHYFIVGVHGAPTKETAPHGAMWRRPGGEWLPMAKPWTALWGASVEWCPLAPPTEAAPAPEPERKWEARHLDENTAGGYLRRTRNERPTADELDAAAEALNALERDGVVWGPPRPMSELPDEHEERVLILYEDSVVLCECDTCRAYDATYGRVGWWPAPKVES